MKSRTQQQMTDISRTQNLRQKRAYGDYGGPLPPTTTNTKEGRTTT